MCQVGRPHGRCLALLRWGLENGLFGTGREQRWQLPMSAVGELARLRRLSLYLRELEALADAECWTVSSRELGAALGLVAVFEKDPSKAGELTNGPESLTIQSIAEMPRGVRKHGVRIGILAVPADGAQPVAEGDGGDGSSRDSQLRAGEPASRE